MTCIGHLASYVITEAHASSACVSSFFVSFFAAVSFFFHFPIFQLISADPANSKAGLTPQAGAPQPVGGPSMPLPFHSDPSLPLPKFPIFAHVQNQDRRLRCSRHLSLEQVDHMGVPLWKCFVFPRNCFTKVHAFFIFCKHVFCQGY